MICTEPTATPHAYAHPGAFVEDAIALESLLRWGKAQGRSFRQMLPLVRQRFAPATVATCLCRLHPQAGSLKDIFDLL